MGAAVIFNCVQHCSGVEEGQKNAGLANPHGAEQHVDSAGVHQWRDDEAPEIGYRAMVFHEVAGADAGGFDEAAVGMDGAFRASCAA